MNTSTGIPKQVEELLATHRRDFLRSAGLLFVSFATSAQAFKADAQDSAAAQVAGPYPDPDFRELDSWIVIHENNSVTFYRNVIPPVDVRRARHCFRTDNVHHGQHG